MNALERHIAETGVNAAALMDWLQGHGIISDNCVFPRDVYSGDAEEAVRRINEKPRRTITPEAMAEYPADGSRH